MKRFNASKLRENIYRVLDEIIEHGVPVEIIRNGVILRIVPEQPRRVSRKSKRRRWIVGDPADLVSIDWSKEWSELK